MYLPPVNPQEAHAVYSRLVVAPAAVKLEQVYDSLYFSSTLLHFVVRIAFLALGLSASFRSRSDRVAAALLKLGIIRSLVAFWSPAVKLVSRSKLINTPFFRWLGGFVQQWQPVLIRSTFVYFLLYTLLFTVLWSPLSYYESFVLPHRYGLSHEPLLFWLTDLARDTTVDSVIGAAGAALFIWSVALFPKRWGIVIACWAVPIIFIGIFLDPLFARIDNHFTPLPVSSPLYAPLHRLAAKAGVPGAQILVADKSKQTDETNAYVTGLGSSAQIVLWDTTIKRMPTDEIVAVIGHELGHYVEHHVLYGGLAASIALFVLCPLIQYLSELLIQRFGAGWKLRSPSDPAALPVYIICLSLVSFAVSPISNGISRAIEHRADSFGLAVTGNRLAMARALVDLSNQNLSDPYPPSWEVFWLEDHPPFGERIRFALYGQPMTIKR